MIDSINLLLILDEIVTPDTKLYISVIGNGGGYVVLGHILATGLIHSEYPIYGRYNMRKSPLLEMLLKSNSYFEDMHRF